jgi:hypothetical protein
VCSVDGRGPGIPANTCFGLLAGRASRKSVGPEPTITETVEGPISAADRRYASAKIRSICRDARVQRVRIHLMVPPHTAGDTPGNGRRLDPGPG